MKRYIVFLLFLIISIIVVDGLPAVDGGCGRKLQQFPAIHRPKADIHHGRQLVIDNSMSTNGVHHVGLPLFRHHDRPGLLTPEAVLSDAAINF